MGLIKCSVSGHQSHQILLSVCRVTSPILGKKTLNWCMLKQWFFLFVFFSSKQNGSRNFTETGTCPRAKTLSSYEHAGGKRRGVKMLWLTKKTKQKKSEGKKKKKNPGFFFNQLWHFPPVFPNDAITLRICLSILSPFWCISDYLFCRFVRSLALVGHRGLGHIGVSKWREEL